MGSWWRRNEEAGGVEVSYGARLRRWGGEREEEAEAAAAITARVGQG